MKRLFDLIVSLILLICFSPIFVTFAVLVKVKLGSPIIFKQQRPGLYGKPFYLYKLRTMTDERNHKGQLLSDDKRLTPFGQFLRKYSIDEYPQLINVIKGDISLVGPRPLLMDYLPLYTKEQSMRHHVRPGITGWAQINGRNSISWEEKFSLDIWYINNQNFLLDLKILLLTINKVITKEGIKHENHATMPTFKGVEERNEGK
ncbi:sugar transferase [Neobacillus sp. 179-C4.2 HS]|uniref:Sugar transferase n=1 Tax=Neobacillus driksii TaxID=3035913 RepID=A0ABV4Z0Q8_9BACI|nr:sugar transferase [Neobacillus sp. 179.-C4.2 HS]MDP5195982.1 sugar transferase [Neobacillus sp. 179.-C4.2 HS]